MNFRRDALLSRFTFKNNVSVIQFDPSGKFFAAGVGRTVQIWKSPPKYMEFTPFRLLRTFTGHYDDVTSLDWSSDSRFIISGSKDSTCRIQAVGHKFKPVALVAHREKIVACFFSKNKNLVYTASADGAVYVWKWKPNAEKDTLSPEELHDIEFSSFEGAWRIKHRHYLKNSHKLKISSCSLQKNHDLLVVGNTNGVFGLYAMPDLSEVHSLSITQSPISATAINTSGEWLAFASEKLGQLLVWEWQSETCKLMEI